MTQRSSIHVMYYTQSCNVYISVSMYPFSSSRQNFNTALHLAVESGFIDVVEALLTVPSINLGVLNEVKTYIMALCVVCCSII